MQQFSSLNDVHLSKSWLTIGSFDGVHCGHQALLSQLVSQAHAAGDPAVVLTFFPHPAAVLRGQRGRFYINTPEEKAALLGEQGVDVVLTLEFTREFAQIPAADFVGQLYRQLGLKQLWVGFNFALGRNREGDIPTLQRFAEVMGFSLNVVPPYEIGGEIISSSLVRRRIAAGDVAQARAYLGRNFSVAGEVVPGDQRGRTLGIPTANIAVWPEQILPANGIYAGWVWVDGQRRLAVTNVGSRPTFTQGAVDTTVEAYILDFHQDIYGKTIRFEFAEYLRSEERFASVEDLVKQIHLDIQKTRDLLSDEP